MKLLINGPENAENHLILAHGAGAPMDSPFMVFMAEQLAERGIRVTRFEFPYMAARRDDGKKRPPDRAPKLLDCWREVIEQAGGAGKVYVGGKSMGGRMASMIATELDVKGVVCLGYPFHPPGKPEKLRTEHFAEISSPVLICQGERDAFGKKEEVLEMELPSSFQLLWLKDGDHNLKPRKLSGLTEEQNWLSAVEGIKDFLET